MKARDVFAADEIRALTRSSDAAGFWAIGSTWAVIACTFAALARFPHPITFAVAIVVLGGRQLALAILMHDAAHRSLFKRRVMNDVLGDWLCARPMLGDLVLYRRHHLQHHAHTNSGLDPDISLVLPFPTTRASIARKLARDVLGVTGVKRAFGQLLMSLEVIEYTVANESKRRPRSGRRAMDYVRAGVKNTWGFVATNLVIAGVLAASGHLWVFSAWIVSNLTTYSLFLRIRSLAEHACTARSSDPLSNTRTTRAGLLARLTVAPLRVNYHLEHHLITAVPYFRLPAVHRLLRERGMVEAPIGYAGVIALVSQGSPRGA
jgi:fatty acid desaturase